MKRQRLAAKIRQKRKEMGLTQQQLATKCDLAVRTIQYYESAYRLPRLYIYPLLEDGLELPRGSLLDETA